MDALILVGVIVVLVGGVLGAALWLTRARPGQTNVLLLGVAGGEAEMRLWTDRLRQAGIQTRVRQVGDVRTGDFTSVGGAGSAGWMYEVWVRPRDRARAREVLGL